MPAQDFEVEEALDEGVKFRWLSTIQPASEDSFTVEKMRLDDNSSPQPAGDFETIGQDTGIENGVVRVDSRRMTGHPGLFAGGEIFNPSARDPLATFDRLHTRHFERAARTSAPVLDMAQRVSTFEDVVGGLDESTAAYEAARCLSCGSSHECDNCYEISPGDAVIKLGSGKRYKFNHVNCDGCGFGAEESPCGAILEQASWPAN